MPASDMEPPTALVRFPSKKDAMKAVKRIKATKCEGELYRSDPWEMLTLAGVALFQQRVHSIII